MKRLITLFIIALGVAFSAAAQDIVTKKDGTDIRAKILEVNLDNIRYKSFSNLEGPTYTLPLSEILMIQYANGEREIINQSAPVPQQPAGQTYATVETLPADTHIYASDPSRIQPDMKYWDYRKLYDKKDYRSLSNPRYSTGRAAFNLLFPGIAQFTMGERKRGINYVVPAAIMSAVMSAGAGLTYYYGEVEGCGYEFEENPPMFIMLAGAIGYFITEMCSISNAVKIAKTKSLYLHDLDAMAGSQQYGVKLEVSPFVAPVYTPKGLQPSAGLSLALKF